MAEEVPRGNRTFSGLLGNEIITADKNTLFSSFSIHSVLTLLSEDPWFYSKDIFNNILFADGNNEEIYKDILALLSINDAHNVLQIKNKALFNTGNKLQDAFDALLRTKFLYESGHVDFSKSENTASEINAWIEDSSKKTTNLTTPTSVNDKSRLALLNSTYVNGKWAEPFNVENTVPATFHVNETETIQVQMMRMKNEFYYHNDVYSRCKILELPCVNDEVSLVIILPNKDSGADFFKNLNYIFTTNLTKQEVDVSLPKFKIDDAVDVKQYLRQLGLENVVTAEFLGVTENEEIKLNEMRQKSFVDVNEAGVEAAAGMLSNLSKLDEEKLTLDSGMIVYDMNIKTNVSNRFAKTNIVWMMKNANKSATEANFKVVLTETAFITEFVMEIGGKSYKSYIKEKEEAKKIYKEAVARRQNAGLVEAKTRDSKEFTVSVNLEPDSIVVFSLTYEEMLQRIHEQYELVLNICPGQIIDNLNVEVLITESRPLKFVKTPPLRSGNDISITTNAKHLNPSSNIRTLNSKTTSVKFQPDPRRQKRIGHYLGGEESEGLSGQFIVQYDVERDPKDGEILLQDGYFVHFFAPNDLEPLPKHVVFVLDTSGSMYGRKIEQLKDAMISILSDLRQNDLLSIVEFESAIRVWDIESEQITVINEYQRDQCREPFEMLCKLKLPDPIHVNEEVINKAKSVINKLKDSGGTFINGALETALYLVKQGQKKCLKEKEYLPIVVFLTDGEPTAGECETDKIVDIITRLNLETKVPIFTLSFGLGADKNFLRKLSLRNFGFSRHIYEASDASLQLQEFYKQISSPLLADIKFKYDSEVGEVTRTHFPIFFRGSELVVAGKYTGSSLPTTVNCCGPIGPIVIQSVVERPVTSLERLWAYLTVKQLLDERETAQKKDELTKKAVDIALKYSFVTDVTSLVVVKPEETNILDENIGKGEAEPLMLDMSAQAQMMFASASARSMKMCRMAVSPQDNTGRTGSFQCEALYSEIKLVNSRSNYLDLEIDQEPPVEEKKEPEIFVADRPFLVILRLKKDNKVVTLFNGCVYKPSY